ncbi:vanadium-dependent haloperoxidase [Marinicella sp. W31]|uniref:vanadium-dependent haloperoxidase n=1 Tax=Marinicella sp. W31 TaxID=3023713 RepID=UPI0037584C8E
MLVISYVNNDVAMIKVMKKDWLMGKNKKHIIIQLLLMTCFMSTQVMCKNNNQLNNPKQVVAEIIMDWNAVILEIAQAEDGLLTLKGVRTAAMMHAAMHDALNTIDGRYSTYVLQQKKVSANPHMAVTQAAFEVAVDQYPDKRQLFLNRLHASLNKIPDGPDKSQAIKLGKQAATAILNKRGNDRWNSEIEYQWHPMGPGVYAEFNEHSGTPEGFVFGAGWAKALPFVLSKPGHFRVPPPPKIDSKAYAQAFIEVKQYGSHTSSVRTDDQAHLAMWWKDFVENSHNRLARQLVVSENLDLWEASRLFALLNMSVFDAYINVFENKFFYNHWRPYTAIRWAENDGNPHTVADQEWDNLHKHTYAFPSYPSAHGTACAAAMTVLADVFGDDYGFTMMTTTVDSAGPFSDKTQMIPPSRSFKKFSEAALECSMSRIYLGIHFRYDSVEGYKLGSQIGSYSVENFMQIIRQKNPEGN